MSGEGVDLANVALQIVELRGEVKELGTDLRGRDRNTEQLVKFAAEQGQKNALELVELRKEIRDLLRDLAESNASLLEHSSTEASKVRVDLERQLSVHMNEPSAHPQCFRHAQSDFDRRLAELRSDLEKDLGAVGQDVKDHAGRLNRIGGALAVITFIGLPGFAALARWAG